jgi:hypothetical protein
VPYVVSFDDFSGTSPLSYLNIPDGSHQFLVTSTDAAGNQQSAQWTWNIDTTAPVPAITQSPTSLTNQSSATFKFSSNESGSTYSCKVDAGSYSSCTSPLTYTGLSDGSHTFTLQATDQAGNVSAGLSYAWSIDTVAPSATVSTGPPSLTNQRPATFTFSSNDPNATFNCKTDSGSYSNCTSPKTYNWFSEGSHTFFVTAKDQAGNVSVAATYSWTVDSTKPTVTIQSGPADPPSQSTATFTFTASEGSVTFTGQLDANAAATWGWTVDATKPTVTILTAPTDPSVLTIATFTFTGSEPNVTFTCQLDTNAAATCQSGVTYTGITQGTHTFKIYATDQAGNQGSTVNYTWHKV